MGSSSSCLLQNHPGRPSCTETYVVYLEDHKHQSSCLQEDNLQQSRPTRATPERKSARSPWRLQAFNGECQWSKFMLNDVTCIANCILYCTNQTLCDSADCRRQEHSTTAATIWEHPSTPTQSPRVLFFWNEAVKGSPHFPLVNNTARSLDTRHSSSTLGRFRVSSADCHSDQSVCPIGRGPALGGH